MATDAERQAKWRARLKAEAARVPELEAEIERLRAGAGAAGAPIRERPEPKPAPQAAPGDGEAAALRAELDAAKARIADLEAELHRVAHQAAETRAKYQERFARGAVFTLQEFNRLIFAVHPDTPKDVVKCKEATQLLNEAKDFLINKDAERVREQFLKEKARKERDAEKRRARAAAKKAEAAETSD